MIDTDRLCCEFDLLSQAQRDTELKKVGSNWWAGPCPLCGQGVDRFQIKTKGSITKWYCRGCGLDRYHDAIDYVMRRQGVDFLDACRLMARGDLGDYETDPARLAEVEQERQKRAEAERLERQKRLEDFSTRELGEEYHARLIEQNYQWWEIQGIRRRAVDWWKLGYLPERQFSHAGNNFTRPCYTIPKYDLNWKLVNIDYRLVDPPDGVGKYRPEYGLPAAVFLSRPDLQEFPGEVYIVEGSKKAMVTTLNYKDRHNPPMVIGVPSKSSWCGISERVKGLDRVWIALDPDAQVEARRLAQIIGRAARVVMLPFKIDDGFVQHGFSWPDFEKAMRYAT